jgi:hypothetical protein
VWQGLRLEEVEQQFAVVLEIRPGHVRGILTSAWLGWQVALSAGVFLCWWKSSTFFPVSFFLLLA